ncbi:MAG TPA: hypothetical protein V6C89_14530 [Drouetiella sp.]|jgi:hypothetical protein
MRTSVLLLVVSTSCAVVPAFSQTVGNGTIFAPPAGAREAYGINSPQDLTVNFPTRHSLGGNGSGIGTSFIGTTSPTSESSPATTRPSFVADTTTQFHLPKLDSDSMTVTLTNPALQSFSSSMPSMSGLNARPNPWADPLTKPNSFQPLEELPSFNKKKSVTDWMRY